MTTPKNAWPPTGGKNARVAKPEWERDARGRIICGNLPNIRRALAHIGVTLSYDAFARELRVNGAPIMDDIAFQQIWTRITDTCGWQPNRLNLQTVILCDAQTQATHPVRAYLERLTWD